MRDLKFISYDGKWPNLCRGTLKLYVDGKERNFEHCLSSGGLITRKYKIVNGPWTFIDDSNFTEEEMDYITYLVNKNVPHGCCGGCI